MLILRLLLNANITHITSPQVMQPGVGAGSKRVKIGRHGHQTHDSMGLRHASDQIFLNIWFSNPRFDGFAARFEPQNESGWCCGLKLVQAGWNFKLVKLWATCSASRICSSAGMAQNLALHELWGRFEYSLRKSACYPRRMCKKSEAAWANLELGSSSELRPQTRVIVGLRISFWPNFPTLLFKGSGFKPMVFGLLGRNP